MIYAIAMCEGYGYDIEEFETERDYEMYSRGFQDGANHYGCGGASMMTVEEIDFEIEEYDEQLDEDQLDALKAAKQQLLDHIASKKQGE